MTKESALAVTFAYHERTKHQPFAFAASPGYLDWDTQPDPFRRYAGAPLFPLDLTGAGEEPRYEAAFFLARTDPAALDRASISRLFQDALALSAWKQAGQARWALRVNPSSGNLHPTEGYLIAGPVDGLHSRPAVYHYAPLEHGLEKRLDMPREAWQTIATQLPAGAFLVALTSIYWRESWKYGERAFRYSHHDAGHAIASVAVAAAGLGWEARLLEGVADDHLAVLLGVHNQTGEEAEHADCLMAIVPQASAFTIERQRDVAIPPTVVSELRAERWAGEPNLLSRGHHPWPVIDDVTAATTKAARPSDAFWSPGDFENRSLTLGDSTLSLRRIIHQRRSAVTLDGRTGITRDAFYQILLKLVPGVGQVPFSTLPWQPAIDLLLFVHRVAEVEPGLYALVRNHGRRAALEGALDEQFTWAPAPGCPASLSLFLLQSGDARAVARQTSCQQDIAADGAFAVAMLADYRSSLEALGPWFYRRLHWEAGVIGQMLYLEAEASGIRGTGIGCFFDDLTHRTFGIGTDRYQVLYHFTMGGWVDDPRLQAHPPYSHLTRTVRA